MLLDILAGTPPDELGDLVDLMELSVFGNELVGELHRVRVTFNFIFFRMRYDIDARQVLYLTPLRRLTLIHTNSASACASRGARYFAMCVYLDAAHPTLAVCITDEVQSLLVLFCTNGMVNIIVGKFGRTEDSYSSF